MSETNSNPQHELNGHAPAPIPPAEDMGFRDRNLPGVAAGEQRGMLPGMAMIGMYMLLMGMLNAFAAAQGKFGNGAPKYTILAICTLLVVGVFGLLRLRRWGWALVTGGSVAMACGYFYGFTHTHIVPYIIQGLFALVFFLYLVRLEVRDRVR
jgi:hypothetical protein